MDGQAPGGFEVHSEARGPHWVAWLALPGQPGPYRSILLVGQTQAEAEGKAREWAAREAPQKTSGSSSS